LDGELAVLARVEKVERVPLYCSTYKLVL